MGYTVSIISCSVCGSNICERLTNSLRWFWLIVFHGMRSRCPLRLQSSEGLTGAGGSAFQDSFVHMAAGRRPWFLDTRVLHGDAWVFSWHGSWLPHSEQSKRARQKPQYLYDQASEVKHCHFCTISSVTQVNPTQGCEHPEVHTTGGHCEGWPPP